LIEARSTMFYLLIELLCFSVSGGFGFDIKHVICTDLEISRCSGLFMRQIHRNKFFITADQLQRECCTNQNFSEMLYGCD